MPANGNCPSGVSNFVCASAAEISATSKRAIANTLLECFFIIPLPLTVSRLGFREQELKATPLVSVASLHPSSFILHPSPLFISMRFRRPGGGEHQRAERANDDESRKARLPAIVLHQCPQAPTRQYRAGVAKYAGQAN